MEAGRERYFESRLEDAEKIFSFELDSIALRPWIFMVFTHLPSPLVAITFLTNN